MVNGFKSKGASRTPELVERLPKSSLGMGVEEV